MADQQHLKRLKQPHVWNRWRLENLGSWVDLSGANLDRAHLSGANLGDADLRKAHLSGAILVEADLREAILHEADLNGANLERAYLRGADLSGADLSKAILRGVDLSKADLSGVFLNEALFARINLSGATLTNCHMYAISAWDLQCDDETKQGDLIITAGDQPTITVETLEMVQFISLLLKNKPLRDVINTLTSKVVLILGRFSDERKPVLDALRDELRKHDYLPVVFDFEKAAGRDLTEIFSTLAHLARFIIVDPADPNSAPHEMATL